MCGDYFYSETWCIIDWGDWSPLKKQLLWSLSTWPPRTVETMGHLDVMEQGVTAGSGGPSWVVEDVVTNGSGGASEVTRGGG